MARPVSAWTAVALLPAVLAGVGAASDVQPAIGVRAPDLVLKDADGKPVQLSRVLGGKAGRLSFGATWCPPCREEMPTMAQVARIGTQG